MQNIQFPVTFTTILLFLYSILGDLNVNYSVVATLFIIVNIVFLWMVYQVLTKGQASEKTFEEYFYEDQEDLKRS